MLLALTLYLLAHRTRTRHQRDEPHTLLQAQPQRALTIGLLSATIPRTPSRPRATHSSIAMGVSILSLVFPSRRPMRSGSPSSHAETQEHLLEIITPIFAMPIGRRWGPAPLTGRASSS